MDKRDDTSHQQGHYMHVSGLTKKHPRVRRALELAFGIPPNLGDWEWEQWWHTHRISVAVVCVLAFAAFVVGIYVGVSVANAKF